MYLSLSTWLYDHLPFKEVIKRVKDCGYKSIEVSGADWPNKWDWREILEETAKEGIKISSIHCVHHELPDWVENEKAYREYHRKFYKDIAGTEGVIMVEHISMKKSDLPRTREQLTFLAERCKENKSILSVENMPEYPEEQLSTISSVMEGQVYFILDAAHAGFAGIDPLIFSSLFSRLVNVHAYDIARGLSLGDWLPCGLGELNWPEIISALVKTGYTGPLTVELNEKNLRRVLEICKRAIESTGRGNPPVVSESIEDTFAVFSRQYLEKLLHSQS